MDRDTSIFFKPRVVEVQRRLDFLSIPPARIVAFPIEAMDFDGIHLHWVGGTSSLCTGDQCRICLNSPAKPRPYYYVGAYLFCHGTRDWKKFVVPIGGDLGDFADHKLKGAAWKLVPRSNDAGKKKGLKIEQESVAAEMRSVIAALQPFDIRQRILARYNAV